MSIFAPGIVWDSREPLPREYKQHGPPHINLRSTAKHTERRRVPDLTVQEPERNVLAPLSISIDVSILHDTANITTTQVFWNNSDNIISEGAYTFPLPTGCTVTGFSCRIGTDKTLKGIVKTKKEAREEFRRHIAKSHAAGLLEENTPEIFTTTLGNIPANTKLKVEVTFITLLRSHFAYSKNTTTLTIPTCIASRYGSPEGFGEASSTNVRQGLSLSVEVLEPEHVSSLASRTHKVTVDMIMNRRKADGFADLANGGSGVLSTALVRLESGSMFLDKDFVLDIETKSDNNKNNPQAWLEEHPTMANHKALMLTLPQKFLFEPQPVSERTEIIFLADRSGSMSDKMEPLKSAMQFFLKGIPEERMFNIWSFGDSHTAWCPRSVEYTEATLEAALAYVSHNFEADMGGTELLSALDSVIRGRAQSVSTDIIILTDGQVWRLDQTLQLIRDTRKASGGKVRFFSLGIGDAVSHALVEGIAKAGGGYAEIIPAASQGGWEDSVVAMVKAAFTSKHIGPLYLAFEAESQETKQKGVDLTAVKQSPADPADLSPFIDNRVWMLIEDFTPSQAFKCVLIKAVACDGTEKQINVPIHHVVNKDATIHKLAARAVIDDLDTGRSQLPVKPASHFQEERWEQADCTREQAEQLAMKWSITSKWTSFLVADQQRIENGCDEIVGILRVNGSTENDLLLPSYCPVRDDRFAYQKKHVSSRSVRTFPLVGSRTDIEPRSSSSATSQFKSSIKARRDGFGSRIDDGPRFSSSATSQFKSSIKARRDDFGSSYPEPLGLSLLKAPRKDSTASNKSNSEYIALLLKAQRFDGTFHFSSQAEAEATLGAEVTAALRELISEKFPEVLVYTAAVVVLLERDFTSCQALWVLMRDKASAYLQKHGDEHLNKATVKEKLQNIGASPLAGVMRMQGGSSDTESCTTASESDVSAPSGDSSSPQTKISPSRRVLVERVPIDERDAGTGECTKAIDIS